MSGKVEDYAEDVLNSYYIEFDDEVDFEAQEDSEEGDDFFEM